jgi:uncharacterized phiE125 gp8 family phage protein
MQNRRFSTKIERIQDSAVEPITLDGAKSYLRLIGTEEDDFVSLAISAARQKCEQIIDCSFVQTTWKYTLEFRGLYKESLLDSFFPFIGIRSVNDSSIVLPYPPLISLESITYVDSATIANVIPIDDGSIRAWKGTPGYITLSKTSYYPPWLGMPSSAVEIVYKAGYGVDASKVPPTIKIAILMLVAHYFENRNTEIETPEAVCRLLNATAWNHYV